MSIVKKILKYKKVVSKIKESRERGLKVILAQGAFDIVHIGHINYLRLAKKAGDILFVGVENDESIRFNKGEKRPVNSLKERLDFLTELQCVDFVFGYKDVVIYDGTKSFDIYTRRYSQLNPNAVAVSGWDPSLEIKQLQAETAGIELIVVNHSVRDSSTRLLGLIGY